jgi:hypothetical protein
MCEPKKNVMAELTEQTFYGDTPQPVSLAPVRFQIIRNSFALIDGGPQ